MNHVIYDTYHKIPFLPSCFFDRNISHHLVQYSASKCVGIINNDLWSRYRYILHIKSNINKHTFTPRDILHTSSPPGFTDATTTSAPNLVRVSVMHVVSISSLSSAMGTSTLLAADVVNGDDARFASFLILFISELVNEFLTKGDICTTLRVVVKADDVANLPINRTSGIWHQGFHRSGVVSSRVFNP